MRLLPSILAIVLLAGCGEVRSTFGQVGQTASPTPIDYDAIPLDDLRCEHWAEMSGRQREDATEILLESLWLEHGVARDANQEQVDAFDLALTTLCEQRPNGWIATIGEQLYDELSE